ncbi:NACHT domain-containing NTPase [Pseudanabaena sp. BC1403]|uniref:NACHT domain-containing protein n=1 Tax=Pseudanabaena sp. BC1403 TaxID=2043171 RepID=UPI000CD90CC0|nr:NACHT domain-containing protein [Pseudanabaena sp. BC1403]
MTGFEPLITPLVAIALEVLKDSGKKEGENIFASWMKRDVGKDLQDVVFKAMGKYIESYTKRHGKLKVLGMKDPVELDEIFTTVQLLGEDEIQQFATIDDLEKLYREAGQRLLRYRSKERQDGITVASKKQFLMVLGAPGAGKSTFLRKIGLESFKGKKGNFKHQAIPVLLELKKFTESKIDLKALIEAEFTTCGFPKPKEFTESALDKGKLLVLLDGLDEVPSANVNSVIDAIQDFVDRYDKNRYIASCRTAAYRYNFKRFSDVILSEFDDGQIQQFINNWFRSEEDKQAGTAALCWELLERDENKAAKELAHSPILLTFLCLTYDKSQTFANNRSGLYKKALRILLEEWAAEKRIMRQAIYEGLSVELEEVLLSEIACEGFAADRLFIPQSQLVERIKEFLSSNLNAPKQLSGEQVLDAIAIQQGILVERVEDVYSFSHLTLQEYLTARYIHTHGQISQMVEKYLTDKRWREVFLLTSGLMVDRGSDELLLEMHKAAKQYARHPKVKALLQWADQVIASSSGILKPAAKRAAAIVFINSRDSSSELLHQTMCIYRGIDRGEARENARAITSVIASGVSAIISPVIIAASNRARDELEQLGIVTTRLGFSQFLIDLESVRYYLNSTDITRIETQKFIVNDTEELQALNKYLYSIDLLLKCKQEAARLSHTTWYEIEVELLLPPDD